MLSRQTLTLWLKFGIVVHLKVESQVNQNSSCAEGPPSSEHFGRYHALPKDILEHPSRFLHIEILGLNESDGFFFGLFHRAPELSLGFTRSTQYNSVWCLPLHNVDGE